jgi:hypothetical protein
MNDIPKHSLIDCWGRLLKIASLRIPPHFIKTQRIYSLFQININKLFSRFLKILDAYRGLK